MAVNTRLIRRRIKSVKNTRKITKAMELVAASKMRRSVSSVVGTRPYATLAWDMVRSIAPVVDISLHPLLHQSAHTGRVLFVVFTSDRGLAGGFNTNILRKTTQLIREMNGSEIDIIAVGKKGADSLRKTGKTIIAAFTNLTNQPHFDDMLPIARLITNEFTQGKYDEVKLIYTDYISGMRQVPNVINLLPLTGSEATTTIQNPLPLPLKKGEGLSSSIEYVFEPDPLQVLNHLLPRLVETTLYQSLLESAASEHAARMMAMRSASDAADEMIGALDLTYNQARQAGITQEIAEISGGRAALESNH